MGNGTAASNLDDSRTYQIVVRAGYGITFFGGQFDNINILQLNPPTDPSFSLSNGTIPSNPPTATIQNPVSPELAAATIADVPIDTVDTYFCIFKHGIDCPEQKPWGTTRGKLWNNGSISKGEKTCFHLETLDASLIAQSRAKIRISKVLMRILPRFDNAMAAYGR